MKTILAILAFGLVLFFPSFCFAQNKPGQTPKSNTGKLRELLAERRETLYHLANFAFNRFQNGQGDLQSVCEAQILAMEGDLEMARDSKTRLAIHEKQVKVFRNLEEMVKVRVQAGQAGQEEILAAKAARLKAEIDLVREQAKDGKERSSDSKFLPLFPKAGIPKGWLVREWNDLAKKTPEGTQWTVKDGLLQPSQRRGTWLVSEKVYGDFILEFEIKLSEHGNSGLALRAPLKGDPAFEAMELQFADFRYNTSAKPNELTGAIYRAIAPRKQVYRPTQWNKCRVELRGSHLKATLNGELIQDIDLNKLDQPTLRHDGSKAPPVKDRPRRGHIGFQHLSRNNEPIVIREVRIQELK